MPIPKLYHFPDGTIRDEIEAGSGIADMSKDKQVASGLERAREEELERWLGAQSMDTKLLFVMNANWDFYGDIVTKMLDDPKLDRSIAAWVFWNNGMPDWLYLESGISGTATLILNNLARGYYKSSELEMSRCEILESVQDYIAWLKSGKHCPPITIPSALVYPFEGRAPVATPPIDETTREELEDILNGNSLFEFSLAQRREGKFEYWAERKKFLPTINRQDLATLETTVGINYLEAVFGNNAAYAVAREAELEVAVRPFQAKADADRLGKNTDERQISSRRSKVNWWGLLWIVTGSAALISIGFIGHRLRTGQW